MVRLIFVSIAVLASSFIFASAHAAEGGAWCNAPGGTPATDWARLTDFDLIPISRSQHQRAIDRLSRQTMLPVSRQTASRLTGLGRRSWRGNLFLIRAGVQLPPNTNLGRVNSWFATPDRLELHWSARTRTIAIIALSALDVPPEQYNVPFILRTAVRPEYIDVNCTSTVHP